MELNPDKIYGILGDVNPIEHDGCLVYRQNDQDYLMGFSTHGDNVDVYWVFVEEDEWPNYDYIDLKGLASYMGMPAEDLRNAASSPKILERADFIYSLTYYMGWEQIGEYVETLTIDQAEEKYGHIVDQA